MSRRSSINSMIFVFVVAFAASGCSRASSSTLSQPGKATTPTARYSLMASTVNGRQGLPPGQHTARPKYWAEISKYVINFTPFQFDYRIENLTPGSDHDLWFSVGSSIEHIDANLGSRSIPMPYSEWRVSGIAVQKGRVIFTAGQSGKIGVIDKSSSVRYIQVVPRPDFPDLNDLVVNAGGEMWFIDAGRRSIGYRSADGRVVENPFPENAYPVRLQHCMGRLWAVAVRSSSGTALYVVSDDLRPVPYLQVAERGDQIADITCDRLDRLWVSSYYGGHYSSSWFDANGNHKTIDGMGGKIAPDREGGVWATDPHSGWSSRLILIHFDQRGTRQTYTLPSTMQAGNEMTYDSDQTLWLAVDDAGSPVAVTRISSREER